MSCRFSQALRYAAACTLFDPTFSSIQFKKADKVSCLLSRNHVECLLLNNISSRLDRAFWLVYLVVFVLCNNQFINRSTALVIFYWI